MEDFGITDIDLQDLRFRAYDPKLNVKLQVYDNLNETPLKL